MSIGTEIAGHRLGEGFRRGDVGDVERAVARAAAERADLGGGFVRLGAIVQMAKRDIGALPREQQRGGSADAARSTGYQGDLVG